ncbi:hypothetical protein ABI_27910 [Asticcacaulis biprosthecium C19]|uniref:YGGT family protein n=1 Tax=Asticcacaulis biprosthecium C19 TaxID=715226 RepID=F4QMD5_9CAUL|nr:YggT family protein [Asticcacaulis biprosthecium]EGF91376.1 hypothetical protein ABI_27910 [Asticcacaulis biprosthecium C19]
MVELISAVFYILNAILGFIMIMLIVSMILSWLVLFNVINTRNPTVYRIMDALERFTAPVLEPFRRFIPSFGGLDLSFLVCVLVIQVLQRYLLPAAERNLIALVLG